MREDHLGVVRLPELLMMRLRQMLRRGGGEVTQTMIDREVERRLRLTLAVDEVLEKWR